MFDPSRDQARQFFLDAWRKHRNREVLTQLETIAADQAVTTIQRGCRGGNPIIAAGAHTVGAGCQRHGCQDRRCAFAACIALAAVSVSHDDPPEKSGSSRCLDDCCVMR